MTQILHVNHFMVSDSVVFLALALLCTHQHFLPSSLPSRHSPLPPPHSTLPHPRRVPGSGICCLSLDVLFRTVRARGTIQSRGLCLASLTSPTVCEVRLCCNVSSSLLFYTEL